MAVQEADGGALSIPSADGYHYADDHDWDSGDQESLTDDSWTAVELFSKDGADLDVPEFSTRKISKRATT